MLLADKLDAETVYSFRCWSCAKLCTLGLHEMRDHPCERTRVNATAEEDANWYIRA
jgi:hypothetical protein